MGIPVNQTQMVEIKSLVSWPLYFKRYLTQGEVKIGAKSRFNERIDYFELEAQIRNYNVLFCGIDDHGNHARIWIVDDEARHALLGKESDNVTLVTDETVKALTSINDQKKFMARLNDTNPTLNP